MTIERLEQEKLRLKQNYDQYIAALDIVIKLLTAKVAPEPVANEPPPRPTKPVHHRNGNGKRQRMGRGEALDIARRLPEPFSPTELAKSAGLSFKAAASAIGRWKKERLVTSAGFGIYRRTAKFGGAQKAEQKHPARMTVPGLDSAPMSLEEKLALAIKERDDAKAKGQQTLFEILEDKVANLQERLKAGA